MDGALRAATEQELLGWLSSSPSALGVDLLEYRTPTTEESLLHLAISREFTTVVHKLVSKNVDVNAQVRNSQALYKGKDLDTEQ
ncbi:unnamed protein product [Aphanomyces euteiches]